MTGLKRWVCLEAVWTPQATLLPFWLFFTPLNPIWNRAYPWVYWAIPSVMTYLSTTPKFIVCWILVKSKSRLLTPAKLIGRTLKCSSLGTSSSLHWSSSSLHCVGRIAISWTPSRSINMHMDGWQHCCHWSWLFRPLLGLWLDCNLGYHRSLDGWHLRGWSLNLDCCYQWSLSLGVVLLLFGHFC